MYAFRAMGRDDVTGLKVRRRPDLVEIGSSYGGWVVPTSLLDADSICYCAGCGEDITFDLGLIQAFGCTVYGFDPTPRAITHVHAVAGTNCRYRFQPIGLWRQQDRLKFYVPSHAPHVSHSLLNLQRTEDYIVVDVARLSAVMQQAGHSHVDLLKLDIEGAEYAVVDTLIEDRLDVRILCIEYDEYFTPLDRNYRRRIRQSIDKLRAYGFELVCAQGRGNYTFVRPASSQGA